MAFKMGLYYITRMLMIVHFVRSEFPNQTESRSKLLFCGTNDFA